MNENFKLYIPGAKSTNETMTVYAPYDNSEIATVPVANEAAVEKALENAHKIAVDRDLWLSAPKRIEILEKTAAIIKEKTDYLATESAREGGKPLIDSKVEVIRAIDSVKICIETLRTQSGSEIPMGLNASSMNKLSVTRKEPIGVVAAVSAFNHPVNLIAHQVAPAVACGCPVIVKPAEDTPLSCFRFIEILYEAGLPEEYCQAFVVNDLNVATKFVTDSRVKFFSFIGSAKVGWMLRSKLAPGARCALEHGGAAPAIVAADADLEKAIPQLIKGGLYHAGQVCVSVQRIFADKSIAKSLAEKLAKEASKLKVGNPVLPETEIGPLIRHGEVDRVEQWVNEAVDSGAELLTGGKRISDSCYECTVLYNPPKESKVCRMEIFGPVIVIIPFENLDDAIKKSNSLEFSFQASIYTRDIDTAMKAYKHLNASAVMVNEMTAFRVDWMPFAGLNISGLGIGGIPYTMHDMQTEKMLVIRSEEL